MTSETLLGAFLQQQGYAVFEHVGNGLFRPICKPSQFCTDILGEELEADRPLRLADQMPFLENFLMDAEEFWSSKTEGQVESGTWIEEAKSRREIALEASALWLAGRRVLVIRNPQERYDERVEVLQKARNWLLDHDRLLHEIQKKEILLHCIIHDLSQPLTAMRGCFSVLGLQKLPPALEELVEIGERQAERQETMIREILQAFSGELAAQQTFHTDGQSAPDVAGCAKEVAREFSAAFEERGARIEVDPRLDCSRDWRVVGDESRLHRIYANLVENALRYSPAGSIVTLRVEDEGRFVRVCVDDQGPGLPHDETATRLFALFSKGKDRGGKAGLGLYFCRITVERWGGTIGCESRPEGGSRFWFRLPRAEGARGSDPQPSETGPSSVLQTSTVREEAQPKSDAPQSPGGVPRPLRILLAEDIALNRQLLADLLAQRGHEVLGVENGREALAVLEKQFIDLILMDIEMPELDGLETTRVIRQRELETGAHIPILAITGHIAERERTRFLAAGMDACVAKSASPNELYQAIEGLASLGRPVPAVGSEAPGTPKGSVIDEAALLERVRHDRTLLRTLVQIFLNDAPKMLTQIAAAIRQRNATALHRAAAALRGSLESIAVQAAADSARRLQQMGQRGSLDGAAETLAVLEGEVEEIKRALAVLVSQN